MLQHQSISYIDIKAPAVIEYSQHNGSPHSLDIAGQLQDGSSLSHVNAITGTIDAQPADNQRWRDQ